MKRRQPQSVLEVAIAKGGFRKGFRVAQFVSQWTIVQQQLGRVPSIDECADWWSEPRSTWYHHLGEFREVFDLAENPAAIAAETIGRMSPKQLERMEHFRQLVDDAERRKSVAATMRVLVA